MAYLYGCLGSVGVYGISDVPEVGDDFGAQQQLRVKRHTAASGRSIGKRGHAYTSTCHALMVVEEHL